jgi:hypothetical protein
MSRGVGVLMAWGEKEEAQGPPPAACCHMGRGANGIPGSESKESPPPPGPPHPAPNSP